MGLRMAAAVLCVGTLVAGCGSGGNQAGSAPPTGGAPAPAAAGNSADGGCPLTAEELSSATSLSWKHRETRKDHPLETLESVKVTACLFTAEEAPQMGGDPLVARVDVIDPEDAGTVLKDFKSNCAEFGGAERAGGGGTLCERNGTVVEGYTGNLVSVYLVNADQATATKLTPTFEKILAGAS